MPMIRTGLLAVALALLAGAADAQQGGPTEAGPAPASRTPPGSGVATGACITIHANATKSCSAPIDEAGCRMQGLEARSKSVWTAGQRCP